MVGLYDKSSWFRLASCVPLSLHILARPFSENEPRTRHDFLEFNKFLAEGHLEEFKITLGWDLDTRRLL
eukprot:13165325-Ditylum_brightwellii.AAC.1